MQPLYGQKSASDQTNAYSHTTTHTTCEEDINQLLEVISQKLISMNYYVSDHLLIQLQRVLMQQVMTKNTKGDGNIVPQETIQLPKITNLASTNCDSPEWKQGLEMLIDQCQPLKRIEQGRRQEPTIQIAQFDSQKNKDESQDPQGLECSYKKICHSDRINYIYMNKVLGKDKMWISHNQGINYTTIQYIIKTFERSGRTNKKQFLNIEYLQGTSHVLGKKAKNPKKEGQIGRGRKKLDLDSQVLFDAFSEQIQTKRCALKLYVDQETAAMKCFTDKNTYPYDLGTQIKELEIINRDIHKGDEEQNNMRDLFQWPLQHINSVYQKKDHGNNQR